MKNEIHDCIKIEFFIHTDRDTYDRCDFWNDPMFNEKMENDQMECWNVQNIKYVYVLLFPPPVGVFTDVSEQMEQKTNYT